MYEVINWYDDLIRIFDIGVGDGCCLFVLVSIIVEIDLWKVVKWFVIEKVMI